MMGLWAWQTGSYAGEREPANVLPAKRSNCLIQSRERPAFTSSPEGREGRWSRPRGTQGRPNDA